MARINGWKQMRHYSNLEDAKENLDENGRVIIGLWSHDDDGLIEHIFEPGADEGPFIVRQNDDQLSFEEEGRYQTRREGDKANKAIMKKYPP